MGRQYNKFKRTDIDLAPLGLDTNGRGEPYFCTPRGARIIGWSGVDGSHCCLARGFGDAVFAVSPMNLRGEWVNPIAEDFGDFLRLLAACGDFAAIEQAHDWSREQFDAFLRENVPGEPQRRVIAELHEKLGIEPMKQPYEYIRSVQSSFDYGRIRYMDSGERHVPEEKNPEPRDWRVYYGGGWSGGGGHPGRELRIERRVRWMGEEWYIPALYICARGVVADICVGIDPRRVSEFTEKWSLDPESDSSALTLEQRMQLEAENPLELHVNVGLTVNGRGTNHESGCGCVYSGGDRDGDAEYVREHYGLDAGGVWVLMRYSFPWATKRRPEIKSISLTLSGEDIRIPAAHFAVSEPGERVELTEPGSGKRHILTVKELTEELLPEFGQRDPKLEYPRRYRVLEYSLTPSARLDVIDAGEGDAARPKDGLGTSGAAVACVGIIGGAEGPTALILGVPEGTCARAACSSLYFELPERTEWLAVFRREVRGDIVLPLIEGERG